MTDQPDPVAPGQPRPADIVGLADSALRTTLEFAVGIAAAGQKVRPTPIYPAGLKPYLKSNRLDAAALTAVRRAVVADESFRDRLGGLDLSDRVDELGAAWLRRADGWEQEVRRLLATARREAAQTSAEAALRKSEKRREAAEQATDRAQAQLIAQHDTVARENKRRERAEEQARLALAQVTGLGEEITGLRRDIAQLRSNLDAESSRAARAEAGAAAAAEQLLAVERIRDKLLARRQYEDDSAVPQPIPPVQAMPPAVSSSNAQAAQALRQAAAATRELASALVAAGEALDSEYSDDSRRHAPPIDSPGPRSKRSGVADRAVINPIRPRNDRKPIPIPGGLHGNSVAAAEHMLRVPNVCVIVDGYNVAKLAWPQLELIDQRECCIDLLEDLARRLGTAIRVVFDGADVVGASSPRRQIRVQFSPQGMSADDVIRRDVKALAPRIPAVVVTNDQAIVTDMRAAGVNIVSTDALLSLAGRRVTR